MDNIALVFENEEQIEKDILKEVLEAIVKELQGNSDRTHQVDTKLVSKYLIFDK